MKIDIQIEIDADVSGEIAEAYMDRVLDQIRAGVIRQGWGAPRPMSQLTFPPIRSIPQWPTSGSGKE